mmetsp:Transcript_8261/g.16484  ORF Transcript_8261/g.16484 Transcript_8261/m.16484 type:complete len:329 (-) Transcript_8261:342-1328(-)|eukprot:CAMPEP_0171501838 /NCGR_PEP_ID=MMETSP0958-20121227/9796_1 /TAXON_ID=87120 /ORGANISM="Aurantiochytrium limacinum, Strain ATCCMYA-1381" /LENGTH=328 /DNA_ID=CAMNT_0012036729 /DNA_START=165 /DNA_END=1151 /DNA_ORIENTATION=-
MSLENGEPTPALVEPISAKTITSTVSEEGKDGSDAQAEKNIAVTIDSESKPVTEVAQATDKSMENNSSATSLEKPKPLDCWEPYPIEYDGWIMSHNAIRLDFNDYIVLVDSILPNHFAADKMQPWMGDNLVFWWEFICKLVHEHHDHEEEIFFPEMNKRVQLPAKMTADHKTLMQNMQNSIDATKALAEAIKESKPSEELESLRAQLSGIVHSLNADMCAHFAEEEEIGLPLFRANFTKKESDKIEARILKTIPPLHIGNFLRPLEEPDRRMYMKKVAKIPAPVVHFILWPKAKDKGAYYQTYTRLYDEIKLAERIPKQKSDGKCIIL